MTRPATRSRNGQGKKARITVVHATSPTCWWSWGYEAAMNRLRLVYGDQVDLRVLTYNVYDDFDEYLRQSGLTWPEFQAWQRESAQRMDVPVARTARKDQVARSTMPATLAALAAARQGEARGRRFARAVEREHVAEGVDATQREALLACAREAGLNLARFERDLADRAGLLRDLERQADGLPHANVGFYNVVVTDGRGRTVTLDHAFEPAVIEGAIDYLSGGTLRKRLPKDIEGYLRANGPAPPSEIARVFGLPRKKAAGSLAALEKRGRARRVVGPDGALCFGPVALQVTA